LVKDSSRLSHINVTCDKHWVNRLIKTFSY